MKTIFPKIRLSNIPKYCWLEKLKSLTAMDISDCTKRIPALLSIAHLLLSSITDCETLVQAEASPREKEPRFQNLNSLHIENSRTEKQDRKIHEQSN